MSIHGNGDDGSGVDPGTSGSAGDGGTTPPGVAQPQTTAGAGAQAAAQAAQSVNAGRGRPSTKPVGHGRIRGFFSKAARRVKKTRKQAAKRVKKTAAKMGTSSKSSKKNVYLWISLLLLLMVAAASVIHFQTDWFDRLSGSDDDGAAVVVGDDSGSLVIGGETVEMAADDECTVVSASQFGLPAIGTQVDRQASAEVVRNRFSSVRQNSQATALTTEGVRDEILTKQLGENCSAAAVVYWSQINPLIGDNRLGGDNPAEMIRFYQDKAHANQLNLMHGYLRNQVERCHGNMTVVSPSDLHNGVVVAAFNGDHSDIVWVVMPPEEVEVFECRLVRAEGDVEGVTRSFLYIPGLNAIAAVEAPNQENVIAIPVATPENPDKVKRNASAGNLVTDNAGSNASESTADSKQSTADSDKGKSTSTKKSTADKDKSKSTSTKKSTADKDKSKSTSTKKSTADKDKDKSSSTSSKKSEADKGTSQSTSSTRSETARSGDDSSGNTGGSNNASGRTPGEVGGNVGVVGGGSAGSGNGSDGTGGTGCNGCGEGNGGGGNTGTNTGTNTGGCPSGNCNGGQTITPDTPTDSDPQDNDDCPSGTFRGPNGGCKTINNEEFVD